MNNQQFRKLMLANSTNSKGSEDGQSRPPATPGGTSLGSRQRSNIPMTPRSLGGAQADFTRQIAERNRASQPPKKFRTFVPKGSKLASGYVDRAAEREQEGSDDREQRLKALEESYKKEEIEKEVYEKLRLEIAGGDLESTHLVKGLDFKLLERVKRGEDVYSTKKEEEESSGVPEGDVDDEFDQLEKQDVEAVAKEKNEKKKGQLSTVSLNPSKKRSRDQILADLKASRAAAKAAQAPSLGDRFRKVGEKQKAGSRIEIDHKGREVLIIVDEDGHEKRKVRKLQPGQEEEARNELLMPDKDAKPLGMEVPEQYKQPQAPEEDEDEDVDIFDDVGDDYDPLAGMPSDSDSDDEEPDAEKSEMKAEAEKGETQGRDTPEQPMAPPPKPAVTTSRNYFSGAKTGLVSEETTKAPSMDDPAIMAAIKRAAALNPIGKDDAEDEEDEEAAKERKAKEERRRKMLENANRDDEDLDMGFGTSRYEDEEDFNEKKVKLSKWGDDEDGGDSKGGKSKRKRGSKKRKGDVNSAADVLRVMEQRKK